MVQFLSLLAAVVTLFGFITGLHDLPMLIGELS